jgi:uracil-DNA glycosylase
MDELDYDPGPSAAIAAHLEALPDYGAFKDFFWYDWGPIFYRGRLDGSAKVICVASDPGPTERIAGRTLVGDAGQRVQGFLAKLGLSRSYVCLNAFAHAVFPSKADEAQPMLALPEHLAWRNTLYDFAKGPPLRAIVAFGKQAQAAVGLWPGAAGVEVFKIPHPSSHDALELAARWRAAVTRLRDIVTPDADGPADLPNYGDELGEGDYAPIPRRDLPFGVPAFLGDDAWLRASAHEFSSVKRPNPDDRHTLIWKAPTSA